MGVVVPTFGLVGYRIGYSFWVQLAGRPQKLLFPSLIPLGREIGQRLFDGFPDLLKI
jgi:hypothetical protein